MNLLPGLRQENLKITQQELPLLFIFAMSAKCTHLKCRVVWVESENGYHCPCHGAQFDRAGINGEGPAPSPLPRLEINLDKDSRIVVDKGKEVNREFRLKV
jgi:Rieske Fe-S protein